MYVCVAWQIIGDDENETNAIERDVDHAFGALPRCALLHRAAVLRPKTTGELTTLIANLDNIEAIVPLKFGYVLLMHTDRDRFRCSEPFDQAAAQAVTKAVPL